MANLSKIMFLVHLLFFYNIIHTTKLVEGDEEFIKRTCENTQYFDVCISSLKSNPSSSESDLKGLATIMVKVGITNASETYSYLTTQLSSHSTTSDNNTSATKKKVYELCASKYSNANDSLKSSLEDLSMEDYDYASMHVMGASAYPNACGNAFKRVRGLDYPKELRVREEGFKHICAVVLGLVEQLYSIDNSNRN